MCGEAFTSTKLLEDHLRDQHVLPGVAGVAGWDDNGEGVVCEWSGCDQLVLGSRDTYLSHVLFHPYHCFLKLLGLEFQVTK